MKNYSAPAATAGTFQSALRDKWVAGQRHHNQLILCRIAIRAGLDYETVRDTLRAYDDQYSASAGVDYHDLAGLRDDYAKAEAERDDPTAIPPPKPTAKVVPSAYDELIAGNTDLPLFDLASITDAADCSVGRQYILDMYDPADWVYASDSIQHSKRLDFHTAAEWANPDTGLMLQLTHRCHIGNSAYTPNSRSRAATAITAYRTILLDIDHDTPLPIRTIKEVLADKKDPRYQQLVLLHNLVGAGLPIRYITYTGNRGFHAVISITSIATQDEWDAWVVRGLYPSLAALGFDAQCSSPTNCARLPGARRIHKNGREITQSLIYRNPDAPASTPNQIAAILARYAPIVHQAANMLPQPATGLKTPLRDAYVAGTMPRVDSQLIREMLSYYDVSLCRVLYSPDIWVKGLDRLPAPTPDYHAGVTSIPLLGELVAQSLAVYLRGGRHVTTAVLDRAMANLISSLPVHNQVAETIGKVTWDGIDRVPMLCESLGITDKASARILHLSLRQAWHMLLNTGSYVADIVPVLVGPQGCGKSTFLRNLVPVVSSDGYTRLSDARAVEITNVELYGSISIDPDNKDSIVRATTRYWIAELREIASTTRRDRDALKGFLTDSTDDIRLPYDKNTITRPRRTVYFGTSNDDRFLTDETGNRRFFPIHVRGFLSGDNRSIRDEHRSQLIANLPDHANQIWAQIKHEYETEVAQGRPGYQYDPTEIIDGIALADHQDVINSTATRVHPCEETLREYYNFDAPFTEWRYLRIRDLVEPVRQCRVISNQRSLGVYVGAIIQAEVDRRTRGVAREELPIDKADVINKHGSPYTYYMPPLLDANTTARPYPPAANKTSHASAWDQSAGA